MSYLYISLPIRLASVTLIDNINQVLEHNHSLVCYSTRRNELGFSGIQSSGDIELICQSEEEFHQRVSEHKLLRLL